MSASGSTTRLLQAINSNAETFILDYKLISSQMQSISDIMDINTVKLDSIQQRLQEILAALRKLQQLPRFRKSRTTEFEFLDDNFEISDGPTNINVTSDHQLKAENVHLTTGGHNILPAENRRHYRQCQFMSG